MKLIPIKVADRICDRCGATILRGSVGWVFHDASQKQRFVCSHCHNLQNTLEALGGAGTLEQIKDLLALHGGGPAERQAEVRVRDFALSFTGVICVIGAIIFVIYVMAMMSTTPGL